MISLFCVGNRVQLLLSVRFSEARLSVFCLSITLLRYRSVLSMKHNRVYVLGTWVKQNIEAELGQKLIWDDTYNYKNFTL